ncbi:hypothetical protein ACXR0O_22810 [Verrucomicrobiota bacterium sgz303538]
MNTEACQHRFASAATRVASRLALVNWLRAAERTALPFSAVFTSIWLVARRAGLRDDAWWALLPIGLWLLSIAVFAWIRKPTPFAALAAWDRAVANHEMFASAWFFEKSGAQQPGALLHLERASNRLREREPFLTRDLPLRHNVRIWWAPLLFVLIAASGLLRAPLAPEDDRLPVSARELAAQVGKTLANQTANLDKLKELSPAEHEKLKGLRVELKNTAEDLRHTETPRDLLEKLERGARDTEKLADALRDDESGALSPSFLSELERNADTADLGNALRAQDLGRAAEEARLLEARLGHRKPTLEEQKRLEEALKRALEAANNKDRNSKLGKHLSEAQRQLSAGNNQGAAGQFGALGEHYGRSAQLQQARNQLRDLAQNFRGAGQHILGGNNLQRLPSAPNGSQPLAGIPNLTPGSGTPGQPSAILPLPMPGQSGPLAQIPIPGSRNSQRGGPTFPIPGSGNQKPGGVPMPIPGMPPDPNGNPQGGMMFPIPGSGGLPGGMGGAMAGGGSSLAEAGGSQAGNGVAPLGADPTKPLAANQTGVVAPVPGAEGPSEVRAITGEPHREQAARSRQELAAEFLKTEEAALSEESLPLSRREQVLRYFTAIRQHLEHQP